MAATHAIRPADQARARHWLPECWAALRGTYTDETPGITEREQANAALARTHAVDR